MKNKDRLNLYRQIEKELKYSRFIHTMGVAFTAASLAERYGADVKKAETAGLLHDCAKYIPVAEMEKICEKAGIPISETEKGSAALLHSKAGSVLASTKYGIDDPEITDAIRYHTTGRPDMTLLDKIIFIADYIEPGRDTAPNLDKIRAAAFQGSSINEALVMILRDTLNYLGKSGAAVDPMTRKTYEYYSNAADASSL